MNDGLATPVTIDEPAIIVRINRRYRDDMSEEEMYESTRGVWRMSDRREGADLALTVHKGVVKEVYAIDSWHPAGTTPYRTRTVDAPDRWEFVGRVADEVLRQRYVGGSVAHLLARGNANPIVYVNC